VSEPEVRKGGDELANEFLLTALLAAVGKRVPGVLADVVSRLHEVRELVDPATASAIDERLAEIHARVQARDGGGA
jgi:hypothetical protein